MNNIRGKIINFTILFGLYFSLVSCETTKIDKDYAQVVSSEPTEIAILMPMSGANSTLGQQYDKLIKLGLEDSAQSSIKITSYDGADERQVQNSMQKIIESRAKIILGPINSPLVSSIAEQASRNNIIIITMSNDPTLAGDKIIVFGHAPLKQLNRITNYYLENNYKNFVALLPARHHSQAIVKTIQELAIQNNATLVRAEFYNNSPESISQSVKMVSDSVDNLNEIEDTQNKPVIYIADDYKNLNLLFDSIHKHNLDKKAVIIGDNRIDIDATEHIDIVFTGSLNVLNSNIIERAKGLGISHMSFMHTMSYDLGRMVGKYVNDDFTTNHFLSKVRNIHSSMPYVGISGNIYFLDSIAQRNYDIIKHEANGTYTTISN